MNRYQQEADFINGITGMKVSAEYLCMKDELEGFPSRKNLNDMMSNFSFNNNTTKNNELHVPLPFFYSNDTKYYKGKAKIKMNYFSSLHSYEKNIELLNNVNEEEVYIELNDKELYIFDDDTYNKNKAEFYYKNDIKNDLFENTNFTSAGEIVKIIW